MSKKDKLVVSGLVQKLRSISRSSATDHYDTAQILASFKNQKLYQTLGFSSWSHWMAEGNVPFSKAVADQYCRLWNDAKRLSYKKLELVQIIGEHGWSTTAKVLHSANIKLTIRQFQKSKRDFYRERPCVGFSLTPDELEVLDAILSRYGMEKTEMGLRINSSYALMSAMQILISKSA